MTLERTESIILRELLLNLKYGAQFIPHLEPELFDDRTERIIYEEIRRYIETYDQLPTEQAIIISLGDRIDLPQEHYEEAVKDLTGIFQHHKSGDSDAAWLEDHTEKWIRERMMHNAVLDLVVSLDKGEKKKRQFREYLAQIEKAECFSLGDTPGLSLDFEPLFDFLQSPEEKFPFQLDILNKMTCGGPSRKTVTVVIAPTNIGKSLVLCHQAADYLRQGRNVVYLTLEMADKKILKRIYANLLDTEINELDGWSKDQWCDAVEELGDLGNLRVREYASRSAHVGNFRQYLAELKSKEKFIPDVIIVDYLNECRSDNMKYGQNVGSYQYFGSICSELRALATECNVVVWTATQTNRDGYEHDPDLKNTSESAQINSGADLIIGINKDENIPDALRFRVLKNRDAEHKDKVFMVGVNRSKMKLFDICDPVVEATAVNNKRQEIQKRKTRKPPLA